MKTARSFSEAADLLRQPGSFFSSPAFARQRWQFNPDHLEGGFSEFAHKLLRRLDGMDMPFYLHVGRIDLKRAKQRFVVGEDPWSPIESPFLDGLAFELRHGVLGDQLCNRSWFLLSEIGFDVAKLAQVSVAWGGNAACKRPGMFLHVDPKDPPEGWHVDKRTYGCRRAVGNAWDVATFWG